jgi:hypothetical protein
MRVITSPEHPNRERAYPVRSSIRRTAGALVCGGVIALAAVGAAAASSRLAVSPALAAPSPPAVVAPTPPAAPDVAGPVPVGGNAIANGLGESLNPGDEASAIEQAVDAFLAAGRGGGGGQPQGPLCAYPPPTQAFLAWGDDSLYALAPDGDFSQAGAWTLNPQASVVEGADPYSGAGQSLGFGAGGQAVSPAMCVTLDEPAIRFFVRDLGGDGNADIRVDVLFQGRNGGLERLTIARVTAGSSWQPSPSIPILVNRLASSSDGGETAVAFAFTAEGLSQDETIGISALYVDPFQSL